MNEILRINNIHKYFSIDNEKELRVLQGIDLIINKASTIGIVGVSGSGKSTLVHIAGSMDRPTLGNVIYRGMDLYENNDTELSKIRNKNFGFVFQFHYLLNELNALENVMLPSIIANEPNEKMASELLSDVGLNDRMRSFPDQLSGGELQRVAIARALINLPEIIFADEPTGELDNENAHRVFELLLDMVKKYGSSLVLVTHNNEFAKRTQELHKLEYGKLIKL